MALEIHDRVKETTTTTGTGTYTLAGAVTGFETFTANLDNGDTTYYCCTDNTDFEIGIGTFTSSGTTLARTTVLASSNSNSAVNWSSGTRTIFMTYPADKAVFEDASGHVSIPHDLFIAGGLIDLKNDGGAVSQIKFYCESSNAHAQTLIGAPHSESASNTLTLPSSGGNAKLLSATSTATVTNKSIDSDNNTITNIVNADIKSSAAIANSKLANSSITVSDGSNTSAVALGGTLTFSGTNNEVEVAESSGTVTIGLPSAITANVTGALTGNADTATALATGRTIGMTGDVVWTSASFDGSGNVTGSATIQAGAVENSMLADDAVGADELAANAVVNASVASGAAIDATKIHDGTISNTEFGHLNNVSSNIQSQLDAKTTLTAASDEATALAIALG